MLLAGGIALSALLVWRFVATLEPAQRFLAPGAAQVEIRAPGEYVLWHEHRTMHEGRSYDLPAALPDGARISVEGPSGALAVQPFSGMSSEGTDGRSASVARFQADASGPYRVSIEGGFPPRPVSVGPNRLWPALKLAGAVLAVLAVSVGGAIAAALLVGVTFFVAGILAYLRRGEAAGTWLESHFTWQIRTFWGALACTLLGIATLVLIIGFVILLASAVWYVYRVVRGWSELNEGRGVYREG